MSSLTSVSWRWHEVEDAYSGKWIRAGDWEFKVPGGESAGAPLLQPGWDLSITGNARVVAPVGEGVTSEGIAQGWLLTEDDWGGGTVVGVRVRPPEPGQELLGLNLTGHSIGHFISKGLALELLEEPSLRPPEEGRWRDGEGEPFFCMVMFLRLDKTLAALEKSANATFILGGVEVKEGEIESCWIGEQILDWTLGVCEAGAWRLVWSWKSPWVEWRVEDLALNFVILTEERTLKSRGQTREEEWWTKREEHRRLKDCFSHYTGSFSLLIDSTDLELFLNNVVSL